MNNEFLNLKKSTNELRRLSEDSNVNYNKNSIIINNKEKNLPSRPRSLTNQGFNFLNNQRSNSQNISNSNNLIAPKIVKRVKNDN